MTKIAYLAQGRVFFKTGSEPPRAWDSRFGQNVRDRAIEIRQRHSWKEEGRGAQFMGRSLLWGAAGAPDHIAIAITSLTRATREDEILYSLHTREVHGVFAMTADGDERRLFHGNEKHSVQHLCARAGHERLACALVHHDGSANIAVMDADGGSLAEVTEGDSVDLAPSWIPGARDQLVFQSAGIGRDRAGVRTTQGPFVVQKLDLAKGEITPLVEERGQDLLGPQMAEDGTLYYIRRPYKTVGGGSFLRSALDFALFPFRLLYAVFQYLNFFTARYTGRPLTTAGGPERKGADARQMLVWGNLIEAQGASGEGDDPPAFAPPTWQLVRRRPDGRAETVASGVVSFDRAADGTVVYSTGSAIYRVVASERPERICTDAQIEQVVALA